MRTACVRVCVRGPILEAMQRQGTGYNARSTGRDRPSTTTARLLQHSTLEEIADAQRASQLERLYLTDMCRYILQKLGLTSHVQHGHKQEIPPDISDTLTVVRSLETWTPNITWPAPGPCHGTAVLLW
ncbi:hypothetical protein HPB50_008944 [Hyalomma asiaticum]|uniref:Uncharacterized protein n=1 Tax=Hyalomma asiaticum TaxID=266040 RepID=A0ACB7RYW2_HYAAI|nr:hypothetical protein HPB50_008944 [Hyalomma asiaticum]